jgi:hypothetical protein
VQKTIPAPGAAGEHGETHSPEQVEVKAPVRPLMAGIAKEQQHQVQMIQVWAEAASVSAPAEQKLIAYRFVDLAKNEPGLALALKKTVMDNDRNRFSTLLSGSDGSGAVRSYFSLLSHDDVNGLFALLKGGH